MDDKDWPWEKPMSCTRSYTSSHTLFNGRQGLALRKTHVLHKELHIKSHIFQWTTRTGLEKNPCPAQGATHQVTHFSMDNKDWLWEKPMSCTRSYTSSHTLFNGQQGLALRKTHFLHKHHRSYTSSHTLFNGRRGLALRKTHVLHKVLHIKSHTFQWTTRTDFVKATHKVIMPQKSHFNSCICLDLSKQSHLLHKDRETTGF